MLFTNRRLHSFAKDPAVIRLGTQYFLYYTVCYGEDGKGKIGVGIAVSEDMENWRDVGELPLDRPYEQNGIGAPAAIVLDARVHLFYQTYGNGAQDAICHAISTDGIHFEKDATNPIYRPTADWCCGRAIDADVCVFRGKLFLYYATRDHAMKIQKIGGACAPLTSDFGRDAWTALAHQSLLTPELVWEGACIEAPATVVENNRLYLFYGGSYNCTPQQIGCAVSDDGVFFRRVFDQPFIPCGQPGEWNSSESGHPYAFRDEDGRVYLFWQGSADNGKTWFLTREEIVFDAQGIPHRVKQ